MNELQLITTERFNGVTLDIYGGDNNEFYMTREEIGQALDYANPKKAIGKLHLSHADRFSATPQSGGRLNPFSATLKLRATDGKFYDTVVYSLKGVMELCRHSHQPKADAFIDFTWDIMERLLRGEVVNLNPAPPVDFLETCGVIKPDPPEQSDEEVARQFLVAIQQALKSREYYLLPKYGKLKDNGAVMLGIYDNEIITLYSRLAVSIYARHVGIEQKGVYLCRCIIQTLERAGVSVPRGGRKYSPVITRHGKQLIAIQLIRPKANAIIGRSLPLLGANT